VNADLFVTVAKYLNFAEFSRDFLVFCIDTPHDTQPKTLHQKKKSYAEQILSGYFLN
jgi:hypothetical protein